MKKNNDFNVLLLQEILFNYDIRIQKLSIYIEAFTHSTYANENNKKYNYERLEFLGDSAISWIITNYLFSKTNKNEGLMSTIKSKLVSGTNFASIAKKLNLEKLILVGHGMKKDGITEYIGEIDKVYNKYIYFIYTKCLPILKKLKRKVRTFKRHLKNNK